MELTFKRALETCTLFELGQMKYDISVLQKQICDRENEIRKECEQILGSLGELIKKHEAIDDDYNPILTKEEVRNQAAPLIKKLEDYGYKWRRKFYPVVVSFLTGE